jgi:hypothetical protein
LDDADAPSLLSVHEAPGHLHEEFAIPRYKKMECKDALSQALVDCWLLSIIVTGTGAPNRHPV